jgi:alkylation response protein AidB-like acyl-CoA dehydrogenase
MATNDALTEADIATQVLEWFHESWDPDLSLIEWRGRLVDSGWAVPSWSSDWFGRDLPVWADRVAHHTIREAGGVSVPLGGGMGLAAPTMYDHGSDELKRKFLRPTLTGELAWCQLFSEPVAGSDLAGLKTSADQDGDEWIVNGQKVWNTSADHADMGILIARTDWDAVKHGGLSYFVIDMHQDGVEVRPIEQMNYYNSFNEVFLTDARVPNENMVGEIGEGWKVARGTLAHERRFSSDRAVYFGRPPGSEGSIGKLAVSEIARRCNHVHSMIAGAKGMLKESNDPIDAVIAEVLVSTPAQSIAGGTDEIQHNILGENMLGLPKEPAVDRGMPFRDVGKGNLGTPPNS